jgi:transposase
LRLTLRPELLAESRKYKAAKLLRQIPCIGPIRAARLLALMQTPHRFRSKRQLWTYSGLGIETRDSAQYRYVALLAKGMKPEMARLTLARKIAAIALTLWKKEERFDAEQLKPQAA